MTMSDGVKRTPRLPAAPTDQCFAVNVMNSTDYTTMSDMYNYTSTMETFPEPMLSTFEPCVNYSIF